MLRKIFRAEKNIIIGVIHFPPLLGYPHFPGIHVAYRNALADLQAFERGGVHAVIIENNYDIPHNKLADQSVLASMAYLAGKIRDRTKLPLGINVLWNDYRASLSLAKLFSYQFIRIPVFVDTVKTACGIIRGNPRDVIVMRSRIGAQCVAVLSDIHVKHATLLSRYSIIESARRAINAGSDGIIVTGSWTGESPSLDELKKIRKAVGTFPVFVGSGASHSNVKSLLNYANGIIVSTSLKKGSAIHGEVNLKKYSQRIDTKEVIRLVHAARNVRS